MKKLKKYLINKKADAEEVVKWALWILLTIALTVGVYFLMKNIGGSI